MGSGYNIYFFSNLHLRLVFDCSGSSWLGWCGRGSNFVDHICGANPGAGCLWPVGYCSPSLCSASLGGGEMNPHPQSLLGKYLKSCVTLMHCKKKKNSAMKHFIITCRISSQELIGKVISLFVHQLKGNQGVQKAESEH